MIQSQPLFYSHYTVQPVLAGTSSQEMEDFIGAKLCWRHNLHNLFMIQEKL